MDVKLIIYQKLIKTKDFQPIRYYRKVLRNILVDLERMEKGRYNEQRSKGKSLESINQDEFERDIELLEPNQINGGC